jgi:hypothetical protein
MFYIFVGSFFFSRAIKYRLYNPQYLSLSVIKTIKWYVNIIKF